MDIVERLTAFANLGAGWVMWLLVALSVAGVFVVLERLAHLWRTRTRPGEVERLRRLVREHRFGELRDEAGRGRSFEAHVLAAGAVAPAQGAEAAGDRMNGAARLAEQSMMKNLAFLGTVGNNAPFVGLLGTVIGIVRAFRELDAGAGQITSGLMSEVGEALVATAIGILVALPAVAFYNWFQRVVRSRRERAEARACELLAELRGGSATPLAASDPALARTSGPGPNVQPDPARMMGPGPNVHFVGAAE